MDSCCKWSPSERISFTKDLGLLQLAEVRMHLYFKFSGSFPLLSEKNKGGRLGNHEKNVTKSSVDRRDFVAAACSLYPQTSHSRKPEHSKALFFAVAITISSLQKYTAPVLCGQNVRASSVSLLPDEKPASAILMKDYLCAQIHVPCASPHTSRVILKAY